MRCYACREIPLGVLWENVMKCLLIVLLFDLGYLQSQLFGREQDSPRERWNLNGDWLFERQAHGTGELGSFDRMTGRASLIEPRFLKATDPAYDDAEWQPVDLPHTW